MKGVDIFFGFHLINQCFGTHIFKEKCLKMGSIRELSENTRSYTSDGQI